MRMTITIRTDEALREALEQRASAQGKTLSEVAREILRGALADRALGGSTRHLKGRLDLQRTKSPAWRETLRQHNWRP